MSELTKIFFGEIDKEKLLKSQNYERGFWDFEEDYVKLNEPINWEHGVFQYFSNNHDEFWSTVTGHFKKTKQENFIEIKNELIKIHNDFSILSDLIELITSSGGDWDDVKDEFDWGNTSIEGEKGVDFQFINLENYGISNIEKDNSVWIFEVLKYEEVIYNIENNNLDLTYESSEDLKLIERFSFSVLIKK
mgnify:CR=1 FL=1|tara:strand:+ start:181 stop:753 length:573 start_codon:yes stop_codon:yes gene_type:complete